MRVKLLILFLLACGVVALTPGIVLADGHGHGGHGHGGHGHGGGWGHTNIGFSFGLGYYGPGPYYYPYYYPYYSPYYYPSYYPSYPYYSAPSVVYVAPPAAPPVVVQSPAPVQQYSTPAPPVAPPAAPAAEIPAAVRNSNPAPTNDADLNKYVRDVKKSRFWDQLQQGDKAQKLQAIDQLAEFSYDDQVMAAFQNILLSDPDAAMRKAVAEAFGKVKNQKSIGVLEKVRVNDSDLQVRQAADMAIKQIKG